MAFQGLCPALLLLLSPSWKNRTQCASPAAFILQYWACAPVRSVPNAEGGLQDGGMNQQDISNQEWK